MREDTGEENQNPRRVRVFISKKCDVLLLIILSFLVSLPFTYIFADLIYSQPNCEHLLHPPKLQYCVFIGLAFVFSFGNLFAYGYLPRYPIVPAFLLINVPMILLVLFGFALAGVFPVMAHNLPGSPSWLKSKFHDGDVWPAIGTCLYEVRTCEDFIIRSGTLKSFHSSPTDNDQLSSTEVGCCRPPRVCGMELVNATYRRRPANHTNDETSGGHNNRDCDLWDEKQSVLCYNCETCKDGYMKYLQECKWLPIGPPLGMVALACISMFQLFLFGPTIRGGFGSHMEHT
ncbi:unnamed protein product [Cuscuta epithymum]|uniref:Uncharacterized protein n=1 Tax=Cuscuta epithymum TaxID=186058 RepID=A0AAV0CAS6_9ASTE|nr:unnamed protein product [Cuscuta epithymum]